MNIDINEMIELNKDPMLVVRDHKIAALNSAAQKLFLGVSPGRSAAEILPGHILSCRSDKFVTTVKVIDASYSASVLRTEDGLLLSLSSLDPDGDSHGLSSDSLTASLISTLCNIRLALERITDYTEDAEDEKMREYLSILRRNYFCLCRQITNLDAAVMLRHGCIDYSPAKVDLARLCSDLVSTVSLLLSDKHAGLEFSTELGTLEAIVDSEKVERILLNLLTNSLMHTPAGGCIRMGLSVSGGNAVISVDDNGSGIPENIMRNVFTRYEERLSDLGFTAPPTGGLGLGVSRGFAQLHGGALIIESREGLGTSVRVLLPLERSDGRLESTLPYPPEPDMSLVLTELSGILSYKLYTENLVD